MQIKRSLVVWKKNPIIWRMACDRSSFGTRSAFLLSWVASMLYNWMGHRNLMFFFTRIFSSHMADELNFCGFYLFGFQSLYLIYANSMSDYGQWQTVTEVTCCCILNHTHFEAWKFVAHGKICFTVGRDGYAFGGNDRNLALLTQCRIQIKVESISFFNILRQLNTLQWSGIDNAPGKGD